MDPATEDWFARRTWQSPAWSVPELVAAKRGRRVSVVLPALDEEATVAPIVAAILPLTDTFPGDPGPLVDELVVMDSGSTDRTVELARAAGARVVLRTDVLAHLEPVAGKGEVLWRSLAATTGDVIVYLDSDLVDFDPAFVPALLGPMLVEQGVELVKGFYRRPLRLETADQVVTWGDGSGGRVTELVARPLLAAIRPELSGLVQPLGGEYAGTRELLESVPFASGYGVEIGLLLDTHARCGMDAIGQVNLGVRKHRNRSLLQLGVMARQILAVALARACTDRPPIDSLAGLTQFRQVGGEWLPTSTVVPVAERPPIRDVLDRARAATPADGTRVRQATWAPR